MMLPTGSRRQGVGRKAITLIEILISVAMLSGAVVPIMQALVQSAYVLSTAKNRLEAYTFCRAKMVELEINFRQQISPKRAGQFQIGHDQFRWRVELAPLPETLQVKKVDPTQEASQADEEPPLTLVTLTVGWSQGHQVYESHVSMLKRIVEEKS